MSTAEQIIAEVVREHTPMHDNGPFGDDPWTGCASKDCADWPGGDDEDFDAHVAAHVVAALTNAGKTIVELPEADEVEHCRAHEGDDEWVTTTWKSDLAYVSTFEPDANDGPLIHMRLALDGPTEPKHLRDFAAALLAAARVAEGGERSE